MHSMLLFARILKKTNYYITIVNMEHAMNAKNYSGSESLAMHENDFVFDGGSKK